MTRRIDRLLVQWLDHYRLMCLLGEGGFAAIYLGELREAPLLRE
jgi:hypothetical protein